ncbi:hypothetical protein Droror1_Dr00026763 [Drosera rotundifolia]
MRHQPTPWSRHLYPYLHLEPDATSRASPTHSLDPPGSITAPIEEDEFLVVVCRIPLDGGGDGRAVADWLMVVDETVNGFDERPSVSFVMGCWWIWVVDGFGSWIDDEFLMVSGWGSLSVDGFLFGFLVFFRLGKYLPRLGVLLLFSGKES